MSSLRPIVRSAIEPVCGAMLATLVAATVASWGTVISIIVLTDSHPFWPKLAGSLGLCALGLGLSTAAIVIYSLPVLLCVWLPLWLARTPLRVLWGWRVAPAVGGLVGFVYRSIVCAAFLRPVSSRHGFGFALYWAEYVGAVVGVSSMFATGSYRIEGASWLRTAPVGPDVMSPHIASSEGPQGTRLEVTRSWYLTTFLAFTAVSNGVVLLTLLLEPLGGRQGGGVPWRSAFTATAASPTLLCVGGVWRWRMWGAIGLAVISLCEGVGLFVMGVPFLTTVVGTILWIALFIAAMWPSRHALG